MPFTASQIAEVAATAGIGAAFPLQEASQAYAHKPVRGKNVLVVDR